MKNAAAILMVSAFVLAGGAETMEEYLAIRPAAERPADFDSYWEGEIARLDNEVPVDAMMTRDDTHSTAEYDYYRVSFATFNGSRVYGFLTVPKGAASGNRYPVIVQVPGAGPNSAVSALGCSTHVTLLMTVFDFDPPETQAALEAKYNTWIYELQGRDKFEQNSSWYGLAGVSGGREGYYFHDRILGINRAVTWLAGQAYVDRSNIGYAGQSQGGAFGYFLTALNKNFTQASFMIPAISDQLAYRAGRKVGWPNLVRGQTAALQNMAAEIAPYFDAANFARRIEIPVRVLIGLADTTCPPTSCFAAYNSIASLDKVVEAVEGMGHAVDGNRWAKYLNFAKTGRLVGRGTVRFGTPALAPLAGCTGEKATVHVETEGADYSDAVVRLTVIDAARGETQSERPFMGGGQYVLSLAGLAPRTAYDYRIELVRADGQSVADGLKGSFVTGSVVESFRLDEVFEQSGEDRTVDLTEPMSGASSISVSATFYGGVAENRLGSLAAECADKGAVAALIPVEIDREDGDLAWFGLSAMSDGPKFRRLYGARPKVGVACEIRQETSLLADNVSYVSYLVRDSDGKFVRLTDAEGAVRLPCANAAKKSISSVGFSGARYSVTHVTGEKSVLPDISAEDAAGGLMLMGE